MLHDGGCVHPNISESTTCTADYHAFVLLQMTRAIPSCTRREPGVTLLRGLSGALDIVLSCSINDTRSSKHYCSGDTLNGCSYYYVFVPRERSRVDNQEAETVVSATAISLTQKFMHHMIQRLSRMEGFGRKVVWRAHTITNPSKVSGTTHKCGRMIISVW